MNAEVKETVKQCSQCNDSKPRIRKTLCSHHIPDRPWGRIAVDQFTSWGKEFIVNFYSDFIEVKELRENTSTTVVELIKEQFSRYGVCVLLIVFYKREDVMILLPYMAYISVTTFCNKGLLLSTTWHVPLSNTCEANSVCHSLLSDFFCSPSTYFLTYISACTNLFRFTFSN